MGAAGANFDKNTGDLGRKLKYFFNYNPQENISSVILFCQKN